MCKADFTFSIYLVLKNVKLTLLKYLFFYIKGDIAFLLLSDIIIVNKQLKGFHKANFSGIFVGFNFEPTAFERELNI